jgi:hypothetical protein
VLHRRAAEVLRDEPERAAAEPEVIAHHFTEAGLDDQAIEWWGKAGDQALRRSAFQEAIAHLGKAIAMADKAAGGNAAGERLHLCVCCNRLFLSGRSDQAFCCPACRQLAYRRRRVSGIDASRRATTGPWLTSTSPGKTPEAAPRPALGPRDSRTGRVIDVRAMIG